MIDDIRLSRATDGNRLTGYRDNAEADAQATPTFHYWPGTATFITYNKTALWLHTLERHLGWPVLQKHHVHLLRALEVPASAAGGLLRGGERGQRPRT